MNRVEILATCRNPKLVRATLLVFDTIRVGFPTSEIVVHGNGLHPLIEEMVWRSVQKVGGKMIPGPAMRHDDWVQKMIWLNDKPFVICDTDMIFWEQVQQWEFDHPWAGRLTPEYLDPYSKTIHRQRLHTSLLFIRPDELRDRMLRFDGAFPKASIFPHTIDFIHQQLQPVRIGETVHTFFMDTGANLYHSVGGDAFTEEQLDCFSHLHAGTWSDLINDHEFTSFHEQVYADPEKARGLWRKQEEFYAAHSSPI